MSKVKQNNENEVKTGIYFHGTYSNLILFFIGRKILHYQFYSKSESEQVK